MFASALKDNKRNSKYYYFPSNLKGTIIIQAIFVKV